LAPQVNISQQWLAKWVAHALLISSSMLRLCALPRPSRPAASRLSPFLHLFMLRRTGRGVSDWGIVEYQKPYRQLNSLFLHRNVLIPPHMLYVPCCIGYRYGGAHDVAVNVDT
jgi:hypothetical protein